MQQTYGTGGGGRAEFIPLMVEIFKDVKAIFKDNPVEAFTKGTGGTEYSFFKQRGLEEAIQKIGAELHSQYFVSYTPNNKDEGGFHTLDVTGGRVSRPRPAPDTGWGPSSNYFLVSLPPSTRRLLVTEKTPLTPLARRPAMSLSASVATTPSSVTLPLSTMMWIEGTACRA